MRLTIAPRWESRVARADDCDVIDEFGALTGVPVSMNTSIDLREEPIF